jgi:hypothetical protein
VFGVGVGLFQRVRKRGGKRGRRRRKAVVAVVVRRLLSLNSTLSLFVFFCSPLAHAPRPGSGDRLVAELLHGDDVDAAHGA